MIARDREARRGMVRSHESADYVLCGWRVLVAGQPPLVRQVIALLREGYSYEEVGTRTGLHPKAIQRCVKRLTKRLQP